MPKTHFGDGAGERQGSPEGSVELRRQKTLLKTGAPQDATFNSAYFSSIARDEKDVIQIFNVGAERMLAYAAKDVLKRIMPADISDPRELFARASALSREVAEALQEHVEMAAIPIPVPSTGQVTAQARTELNAHPGKVIHIVEKNGCGQARFLSEARRVPPAH